MVHASLGLLADQGNPFDLDAVCGGEFDVVPKEL
jgi:hypothetical protein